ncbi:hypothetical protein RHMOL_Rhmol07G0183600 [Rhododendron molle]|uniref:Uncharacterized protein n=1 Tax=Rhododendron molle TaxID=49168 RepID=A0ACC0N354_RHOML|nr:hypothetical protein RHMOL_Rhmol07G0183600 [Rhododendron molle]
MCYLLEDYLRDPSWHPFKVISVGEGPPLMPNTPWENVRGMGNMLASLYFIRAYLRILFDLKCSDDYLKKASTANTGPRFIVAKHSSLATEAWKNLSDAERAPFLELANQRKARNKTNVPKKKKTSTLPVFRSRCSPKALVKLNESLNKDQRTAVEIIGFGSMLTLQCEILKREFISKLVHHFNPMNKTLEFGRMKVYSITPVDVAKALRLPLGTVPVLTNCEDFYYEHIRAMFAAGDEQLNRGVTFEMMKEVFNSGVADAKFQTSYVLFVLSSLLCPTTKDVASSKFYPAVYDLTKISSYAWPQFVLDWLVKVITKFKKRDMKEVDKKKDAPGVSGCVLLLLEMGMNVGTVGVPLIQSWTTNLIMERIAKEENLHLVDPIDGQFPQPRLLHPEVVLEMQGKVDGEGEEVQVQVQVDEGVVEERVLTRPSKKRGNRTVKASKATRTPYVAEPEVKDSKFTKEESQLIAFVMKPARKKKDMKGIVSMDGMMFNPSRADLHNVFKERGWMSNLLFLPILLATCEHWFCVVINLVDKRIEVLDLMNIKSDEKTFAIANVGRLWLLHLKIYGALDWGKDEYTRTRGADVSAVPNLKILEIGKTLYFSAMENLKILLLYGLDEAQLQRRVKRVLTTDGVLVERPIHLSPPRLSASPPQTTETDIMTNNPRSRLRRQIDGPLDAWLAHHEATTRDDLPVIHMRGYRGVMSGNLFRKWRKPSTEPPPAAVGQHEDQRRLPRLDYTLGLYDRRDKRTFIEPTLQYDATEDSFFILY